MKVQVFADSQAAGRAAAREIRNLLADKPHAVLGLATGHTMIPVYGELVRLYEDEGLSFRKAKTFNLDEYVGLGKGDPWSFREYMEKRFLRQVDLPEESFHIPDGKSEDLEAECARYESLIKEAGGIDLQLLGLGRNGHIGFNEPGSSRDSRTRVVRLSEETRNANAEDFPPGVPVPERAITMGIATILEARSILLVVTGREKAGILKRVLETDPTEELPASFLHLHPRTLVIADREAMGRD